VRLRSAVLIAAAAASIGAASIAGLAGVGGQVPGLGPAPPPATSVTTAGLAKIADQGHVTYSVHIRDCHTRDHGQLPDRACTPGSIDPAVTQANIGSTICRDEPHLRTSSWTSTIRPPKSQTEHAKFDVAYPAYGITGDPPSELDHEVPLELGGSNDITNLWAELGPIPNPKDRVEDALNHAVCDGTVTLAAAQRAIARNWMTAERRLGLSGGRKR
jgi:hypothetical protein